MCAFMKGLDDKVFCDSWRLGSVPLFQHVSEKLHMVVRHDQERSEWGSLHVGSEIEGYTFKLFLWKWNFNFLSQFVRSIWAY